MKVSISGSSGGAHGNLRELAKNAEIAEEAGFDVITMGDNQNLKRDLYMALTAMADATESIAIGPMVTNPITRHPGVTANAMCTLNDFSGGRAILGIGAGDSAVHTLGEKPARLRKMKEDIELIRALSRGESVEYNDSEVQLSWVDDQRFPIYWAAEGPKTQHLAGALADVVVAGTGILPEIIDDQIERVREGARDAGRDPDEVEIWVMARCNVDDDRETAIDELKPMLAAHAHHSLGYSMEGKRVPEEYVEPIEALIESYNSKEHGLEGGANRDLLDELELTDYLVDRFGVVGTPEDCLERLREMEAIDNLDGIHLVPSTGIKRKVITSFGEQVLPHM